MDYFVSNVSEKKVSQAKDGVQNVFQIFKI